MLLHIDSQGNHFLLIKYIKNHCKYVSAINRADGFLTINSVNVHAMKTTRFWTFLVEWKGGPSKWVTLVDLKHYNTIELT